MIISNHNTVIKKHFTTQAVLDYFISALAKSKAEPRNSNNEHMAHNTPLNACFFMRSIRAPKKQLTPMVEVAKQHLAAQIKQLTSMVTCSGKGFALCCVPYVAVFEPVTRYRPKASKLLAVTSKNLFTGVTDMLYRFKAVSRLDLRQTNKPISSFPRYTVRINADTIEQAKAKITPFFVVLGVMRNSCLTTSSRSPYAIHALAKSKASRDKLNRLQANSSTPLNRAFFVRRFHTSKRKTEIRLFHQSMMACSRQPLMVGCFPVEAVCHPATRYRQSVTSEAIAFNQLTTGLLAMIYQFLAVSRLDLRQTNKPISSFPRYTVRINAGNIKQATAKVSPFFVILEVQHG